MKSRWMTICCALIYSCIVFCTSAFAADAVDQLYLCGIIEEINTQDALVTVDVASDSCRGLQKFKLPAAMGGASFNVDQRKCFFIDSSRCNAGYIYTITKIVTE